MGKSDINYYLLLIFLLLIFLNNEGHCQIIPLNGTRSLSEETKNFVISIIGGNESNETKDFLANLTINNIGISKAQKVSSDIFYTDKNVTFKAKMLSSNGDNSAIFQQFYGASYKNKGLKDKEYRMNYSLMENVYTSDSISMENKNNDTDNLIIDCEYKIYSPISRFTAIPYTTQYTNIQFYLTKIFGMDQEKSIFVINNYTNSNNNTKINDIYIDNKPSNFPDKFDNYYVIKSFANPKGYLFAKSSNVYYLLEIVFEKSPYKGDIAFNCLSYGEITNINNYYNASVYEDKIYISTENGIHFYSINNNLTYIDTIGNSSNYISIAVVDDYLFGIQKKAGLTIFNLRNKGSEYLKQFPHSKLKSIEYYVNPFYGYKFLGLLIDRDDCIGKTSTTSNEFFIELYLPSSNIQKPKINKIFTQNNNGVNQIMALDFFYLYFYDSNNKNIIVIRKGLFNSIPSVSYVLPTKHHFESSSLLVPFKNTTLGFMHPALTSENLLVYPKIFSFRNHYMDCTIKEGGYYTLVFLQKTDACESSIKDKTKEYYCYRQLKYQAQVFGDYSNSRNKWIRIGVCLGILVIILCVGFWVYKYNKGFSENRLKLIHINKDDKRKLYMDDSQDPPLEQNILNYKNSEEIINEQKGENRETEEQTVLNENDNYQIPEGNIIKKIKSNGSTKREEEDIVYKISHTKNKNNKKRLAPLKPIESQILSINRPINNNEEKVKITDNENNNFKKIPEK